jgi:hypothetical protein
MQLDRWQRLRVAALRPLARWLRASPRLRRRLEASERAWLDRGLDRDLALLAALDRRTGDSQVWTRGPAAARRAMRTGIALVDDPGHQLAVVTRDLTVAGAVGLRAARVYAPTDLPAIAPGLVFFHGGGWVTGDLDTHDAPVPQARRPRAAAGDRRRLPAGARAPLPGGRRRRDRRVPRRWPRAPTSSASIGRGSRSAATAPAATCRR